MSFILYFFTLNNFIHYLLLQINTLEFIETCYNVTGIKLIKILLPHFKGGNFVEIKQKLTEKQISDDSNINEMCKNKKINLSTLVKSSISLP